MTNRSNKTKRCAPAKASKYFKLSSVGAEGAVPRAFAGITHKGRTPKKDTNVRGVDKTSKNKQLYKYFITCETD